MTVDVLGPLEAGVGLRPRERAVLAALAARAGRVVTSEELASACWGDEAPRTWWQQIKTSVTAIRARLGPNVIVTHRQGYALGVDPATIDAVRFERLVSVARAHAIDAADDRAVDAFTRALGLWRGPALPEVEHWQPAHIEAQRWEELRRDAEEELLEARLRRGETREVVPAAEGLVSSAPLRENRWRILALALYRSDRQAEALDTLRRARRLLATDLGVEPGEGLRALEVAILNQDPDLAPPPAPEPVSNQCPYQGLRVFDAESADRFFGRELEALEFAARIASGRLAVISGASGVGKSSFLRAGVVPLLMRGGRSVRILPGSPAVALAAVRSMHPIPDVVVLDQFETVLRSEAETRLAVDAALQEALHSGAAVVLAIRSDFLDDAVTLPSLGDALARSVFVIGPLSPAGLRDAIERPARDAGLRLESGLVELMLHDAGDHPSALPHLSYALVETWLRREGAVLTIAGYESSGGLAGAITQSAERRFQTFSVHERVLCQSLFLRLFQPGPAGGATQRRIPLSPLSGDDERRRVIEGLVRARLVATDGDSLVVAHEAVGRAWARLRSWLEDDALDAQLLRDLEAASRGWELGGRTVDDLLRGARLHAALDWREASHPDITPREAEYLEASAAHEEAELSALAERARAERRLNKRLRWALAGASVLLTGALISTSVAIVRGTDAVRAERDASTEALAATSQSLVGTDRDVAALLAAELYRRSPDDPRARSAILAVAAAAGSPTTKVLFPDDEQVFGGAIPGTDTVLIDETTIPPTSESPFARMSIWDAVTGKLVRVLPATLPAAPTPYPGRMAFSADGKIAAVLTPIFKGSHSLDGCCDAAVSTIDLVTGRLLATSDVSQVDPFSGVEFTHRGRVVLRSFGAADVLWLDPTTLDVVGRGQPGRRNNLGKGLTVLAGGQVALSWPDRIDVYDGDTTQFLRSIPVASDVVSYGLTAVASGEMITTGPEGMTLMDELGTERWSQPQNFTCYRAVAVPGSNTFVCPDPDTHEFTLSDGTPTGRVFSAQSQWIVDGWVLADGSFAVTSQRTTPFLQRFPLDGTGPLSKVVAAGMVATGGFADDRTLVVAERGSKKSTDPGNQQSLWDVDADTPVGDPADSIDVVDRGVVARWFDGHDGPTLSDVAGTRTWSLNGAEFDGPIRNIPVSGGTGGRAFAINSDAIVPFDPHSGAALSPILDFTSGGLDTGWTTIHEIPGRDEAVVSWWESEQSRMVTAVFDLTTGKELVRGLYGDTASVVLPDGDIISTSSSRMRRSDDALASIDTLAKPVAGANRFELSDDGALLLLQGAKGSTALYDTATGIKLGTDIATDSPFWEPAHLSPDGRTLATNASDGILLWNLDPESFTDAACRMAGRDLTAAEWRRYVGDSPQVKLCGS